MFLHITSVILSVTCVEWLLLSILATGLLGNVVAVCDRVMLTRWGEEIYRARNSKQLITHLEYPRPHLSRRRSTNWKILNGIWKVDIIDVTNITANAPNCKTRVPFPVESCLSGVQYCNEIFLPIVTERHRVRYDRHFRLPDRWHNRWQQERLLLHFGAVDWHADVYVNGKLVIEHNGGYSAFSVDITDYMISKRNYWQHIEIVVSDPTDRGTQPRGKQVQDPHKIWYTSVSGIWQTVWIEILPKTVHVHDLWMVPNLDSSTVQVNAVLEYAAEWRELQTEVNSPVKLGIEIFNGFLDGEGMEAYKWNAQKDLSVWKQRNVTLQFPTGNGVEGGGSAQNTQNTGIYRRMNVSFSMDVDGISAWTPESPHLYSTRLTLFREGEQSWFDSIDTYFAMRKISLGRCSRSENTRLLLNNKPYFQMGLLDQGYWPDGLYTAPSDAAMVYDLQITKKLGFNMVRKHVKVEPARWYYWCDVLGLLVWQDMPSGDAETERYVGPDIERSPASASQFYTEWNDIMQQLKYFPSIVMWVIFNEGWGQFDTHLVYEHTHQLETQLSRGFTAVSSNQNNNMRLINAVSGWIDRGVGDVLDVHNYPQPISPSQLVKKGERINLKGRAAVLGEYGGLGLYVERHSWLIQTPQQQKRSWSYMTINSTETLTNEFIRMLHRVRELRDRRTNSPNEALLSAAIYTQTTDVEGEVNGIMTYDRERVKLDVEQVFSVVSPSIAGYYEC
jgi:hypothetical protein